ncbi:MAG: hypothetical protein ACD_35C00163G0003 [uncultured bacterium]|nr:MAG: hypothetical protein ACD_35C00163G0003 [uncultured bacterium]HCS38960.1 hypothetical protein [Anaerolineaceae bacterium]
MILVAAVLVGLIAGLCRAWLGKRKYRVFELKYPVLVLVAFIPQYFAFFAPKTRELLSNNLVTILLVSSLIILFGFSILNIKKPGFWPISIGFLLNFLVIVLNNGFMPISLATVNKLNPGSESTWMIGQRFGFSKDIILSPEMTKLAFLSDRFTITNVLGYNVAFSLGDTFIALGVILLLWMLGGKSELKMKEIINE